MKPAFSKEKIAMSDALLSEIDALRTDKIAINDRKIALYDHINIDDHGFIPFPEFTFAAEYNYQDHLVSGPVAIGSNFKRFLGEMPKYINPHSALATCWVGTLHSFFKMGMVNEDRPHDLFPIYKKYGIVQTGCGGMNHLCPDLTIGLALGWSGLLEKIRYYRGFNAPADTSFYDGEELLVEGIIAWVSAHADKAFELAASEIDPWRKANYQTIGEINRKLAVSPPETFREACQFFAHFQAIDRMYYAGGAFGALDVWLEPYFERDIAAGILTEDEAVWHIASLYFNDTHYYQIGGLTPDGSREMTSRVSFVILDAMHHLRIPINLGVRVHPTCDEELLKRAVEYTLLDGTGVCFSLEKGNVEGYSRNGYPEQLGRMRIKAGCNWVAIPGVEYPLQDVCRLNMAMALHHALQDVKDNPTLDALWDAFTAHLSVMVDCIKRGYDHHYEVVSRNTPEIVLNLFMHGPIERGLNCAEGGVDIMNFNIDGIALATVADSFAAIEQRIVGERRITWARLYELLDSSFEDAERERMMLNGIPRLGNPESPALKWATKIRDAYVTMCKSTPTPKHHFTIIPGLFSHGDVYMYGNTTPATPNGRKAHDPISHSSEPDPGFAQGVNTFSPVLKANVVAVLQSGYGNSAPLHLDIDTALIGHEGGVDALVALIHAHERMGGTLINMNCLSKETLLEAHADPKKHPDLVVRVTGYSAFFASLSREYRQQIVDRFLA